LGRNVTGLRKRLLAGVAGQLGRPHGLLGRSVAMMLNRANRRSIEAAVETSEAGAGDVVADIGFGGGLGLSLLLGRVGDTGMVHGVEIADDMLDRARSKFAQHVSSGRLQLACGSLTALPLDEGSVDALITVNTIYFVPDVDAACAELARVLRPAGRAVVGIGDPEAMARMPFASYGFTLRPISEIHAAMQKAGLALVDQRRLEEVAIPQNLLIARRSQ
jgi:arsenite methyltransferase